MLPCPVLALYLLGPCLASGSRHIALLLDVLLLVNRRADAAPGPMRDFRPGEDTPDELFLDALRPDASEGSASEPSTGSSNAQNAFR